MTLKEAIEEIKQMHRDAVVRKTHGYRGNYAANYAAEVVLADVLELLDDVQESSTYASADEALNRGDGRDRP